MTLPFINMDFTEDFLTKYLQELDKSFKPIQRRTRNVTVDYTVGEEGRKALIHDRTLRRFSIGVHYLERQSYLHGHQVFYFHIDGKILLPAHSRKKAFRLHKSTDITFNIVNKYIEIVELNDQGKNHYYVDTHEDFMLEVEQIRAAAYRVFPYQPKEFTSLEVKSKVDTFKKEYPHIDLCDIFFNHNGIIFFGNKKDNKNLLVFWVKPNQDSITPILTYKIARGDKGGIAIKAKEKLTLYKQFQSLNDMETSFTYTINYSKATSMQL